MAKTQQTRTILCVVGARPNFIKIAPMMRAFAAMQGIKAVLVHTGQHYDEAMSGSFFDELGIAAPDINLNVGSGAQGAQTAAIMQRFEPILDQAPADAVLVVGDVNSTIACALVAAKRGIPVIHLEAGLRSYDRTMPEEINRVLTDQISDLLLTTDESAAENLAREGIDPARVRFIGNVMIDTLRYNLTRAIPAPDTLASRIGPDRAATIAAARYALTTLHRPANVDDPSVLAPILGVLRQISATTPIIFPMHPRTRRAIDSAGLAGLLEGEGMIILPPVPYLSMLGLLKDAALVLTDSGGLQEESTALGIPCLTLRANTERPITVTMGTNRIAGTSPTGILKAYSEWQGSGAGAGRIPPLWDGQAADRAAREIDAWLRRHET